LVIISGTVPSSTAVAAPLWFEYTYNKASASWMSDKIFQVNPTGLFKKVSSDFPEIFGQVFVLKLAAGEYEIRDWRYGTAVGTRRLINRGALKFKIEPGRAVYIGSLEPEISTGKSLAGQTIAAAQVTVQDRRERDLAVFRKKCPLFDPGLVHVQVIDGSSWKALHP
jgi:hypothetical protein